MPRLEPGRAALLLVALVAVVLSSVAATGSLLPGEHALARAWQRTPGGGLIEPLADWLALRYVEYPLVFAAAILALARGARPLAVAALLALAATGLNAGLKELIDRARPAAGELTVREPAGGLGFPSGHAMTAALLYGYAIRVAWHVLPSSAAIAVSALAAAAIALIGWDRVYDGAHWPTDVLGGFAIGVLLLVAASALARLLVRTAPRLRPRP